MPALRKPHHEAYAGLRAQGMNCAEAYRAAVASLVGKYVGGKHKNGHTHGYEWERARGVKERIAELRAENERKSQMTRAELMAFYAACVRTPADLVERGSPVIQAYEETPEGGRKIRIVDKAAAGQALARMCAWNKPEKFEIGAADSLKNYLMALRSQSFFGGSGSPPEQRAVSLIELEGPTAPARNRELGENKLAARLQ